MVRVESWEDEQPPVCLGLLLLVQVRVGGSSELVGDQCEDRRGAQSRVTAIGMCVQHTHTCTYTLEWKSIYIQLFTHKSKHLMKLCGVMW